MSAPWEKYASQTNEDGPWTKYGAQPAKEQPAQSGMDFVSGNLNKGVAGLLGFPVDASNAALEAGKQGINAIFGSNLKPSSAEPFGGSASIERGLAKAGMINQSAEPRNTAQKYGAAALQSVPTAMLPGGSAAGRIGMALGSGLGGEAGKSLGGTTGQLAGSMLGGIGGGGLGAIKQLEKPSFLKPKTALAGVGAAATPEETLRIQRAQSLPVPVNLTKGEASRDFMQQQFEKQTAKEKEGLPLRERASESNVKMLQNFDVFDDLTGSQERNLRSVGKVVNDTLVEKSKTAKTKISKAYDEAKASGAMREPVDVTPLKKYTADNFSFEGNSPIIGALRKEIERLSGGKNELSISDLEELRKKIGSSLSTPADFAHGPEIKKVIDSITEGKGGEAYRQARRLHENYAKEFKNKAVIADMLKTNKGTSDRKIAFEDVFSHSILDGSFDDVKNVRTTLQTSGEKGQQAWKELQGQTVRHIKETITSNTSRDVRGNPIVSPGALNKLVRRLDNDGKLDLIFGKAGAQKVRDINDVSLDLYTSPPGSVNYSNNVSAINKLMGGMAKFGSKLPYVGGVVEMGSNMYNSRGLRKQVSSALGGKQIERPPQ